jgi:3-hydroxyisobutyrate dehydrogenase-like beta-hydroxyacid dehydrogenase
MNPTVAIIAQGAMGSAVGKRLVECGLQVMTSLAGRSEASAKRAAAAGMMPVSDQEIARADYFLSIVPPSEALSLAKKIAALIGPSNKKPIFVDCNAVSPPTKIKIGNYITNAGSPFIDVGIIGLPPRAGYGGPAMIASGPETAQFVPLGEFGLKIRAIDGPIGAASAVKMSYAGITKGITALGSMMMLAATRGGVANELRAELERSHPAFVANFTRAVPDMFGKAYRFVGEMEEIADFAGEDKAAKQMYLAFADFYRRIAVDFEGKKDETAVLAKFLDHKS